MFLPFLTSFQRQLALGFNYICGCEGPGYVGANTQAKRLALVWMPRVSAILSIFGSSFIIVDVVRDKTKRRKPFGQLMVAISFFDILGSLAYSLTTLPIPKGKGPHGRLVGLLRCGAQQIQRSACLETQCSVRSFELMSFACLFLAQQSITSKAPGATIPRASHRDSSFKWGPSLRS